MTMAGYCRHHGVPLGADGKCSQCTSINLDRVPTPGMPVPYQQISKGMGPLPKASPPRRLLGSGVEYISYVAFATFLYIFDSFFGGALFFLFFILLALIVMRDFNAGAFSIAKRISQMRVVNIKSGQQASNVQAILRNSYYLGLPLVAMVPLAGGPVASFFFMTFVAMDVMMILANPRGRRLGDFLAGTQVVEARI
jgi:uncharacterized RDD family membrane protein YckC